MAQESCSGKFLKMHPSIGIPVLSNKIEFSHRHKLLVEGRRCMIMNRENRIASRKIKMSVER